MPVLHFSQEQRTTRFFLEIIAFSSRSEVFFVQILVRNRVAALVVGVISCA